MPERAFPVVYARDVERSARFYQRLGFEEHFRLPPEGEAGYIGLRRGSHELAVTTVESPEQLIGVRVGDGPRFEMFVYVDDVDETLAALRGDDVQVLKAPEDMFWGERLAWITDPDGNPVALAAAGPV
jgi:lactoylglutathione lyase